MRKLDKSNVADVLPLTALQQGMLYETCARPADHLYAIQLFIGYDFVLDETAFRNAWRNILADNELLRGVIRWRKISQPLQVILKDAGHRIGVVHHPEGDGLDFEAYIERYCGPGGDVEEDIFSVALHRIAPGKSLVEIRSHHLIQDGWSTSILLNEFVAQYQSLRPAGRKPAFGEYLSFLQSSAAGGTAGAYWSAYLRNCESRIVAEAASQPAAGTGECDAVLPAAVADALNGAARQLHVSVSTIFHLAWSLALREHFSADEVLFGTVVSGRPAEIPGIENLIGNFVNTLPFRFDCAAPRTVAEALAAIQREVSARSGFEYCGMSEIGKWARLQPGATPFDTVLVIENYPFDDQVLFAGPLRASYTKVREKSGYPLDVSVRFAGNIQINARYEAARVPEKTVRRLVDSFVTAIRVILENPAKPLRACSLLGDGEKKKILEVFNRPVDAAGLPAGSLLTLFHQRVAAAPERTALVAGNAAFSYRALGERVARFAAKLGEHGVRPGEIVGLCVPHTVDRVVALLGTMQAGAAFLPIRTDQPAGLIRETLAACAVGKLVVAPQLGRDFRENDAFNGIVLIDPADAGGEVTPAPGTGVAGDELAYVLMTSGSTGAPKAVLIEHRNLLNTVTWFVDEFSVGPGTRVLQLTDYTFDPSLEDIFGGLIAGAEVHLPSPEVLADPRACYDYVKKEGITLLNYVPSLLHEILGRREPVASLRTIISGGEALSESIKTDLLGKGYALYNNYGPTEITVDCLSGRCDAGKVTLGTPIRNAYCLLLDDHLNLTPIGRAGEICIGGLGVARGYLNDPALTAAKFIADPYHPGGRLYKTGDFGIWQEDGTVAFVGRRDNQVKINGVRVELGQVKAAVQAVPGVLQAEVLLAGAAKRLVAFVTRQAGALTEDGLLAQLRQALPAYLVPKAIRFLDRFPLTPSGKTDTRELVRLYTESRPAVRVPVQRNGAYAQPLAGIWNEILGVDELDPDKSFFELGGDSFGLMKCINRINDHFGLELPLSTLFSYPSVHLLGEHIRSIREKATEVPAERPVERQVPLQEAKNRLLSIRKNR